jgi:hypothetical protein
MFPSVGEATYLLVVGDTALGDAALLRFYTWHVFGLALLGVGGIAYRVWRMRVDGGISRPPATAGSQIPSGSVSCVRIIGGQPLGTGSGQQVVVGGYKDEPGKASVDQRTVGSQGSG